MTELIRNPNNEDYTSENEDGTLIINIPNIQNYTIETVNEKLILTPIREYITQDELNKMPIAHSVILGCLIKKRGGEIISKKTSYRGVLVDILKVVLPKDILLKTTLNIKLTNENREKGYQWCDDIRMSFQNKDATGTLREILNMVRVIDFTIELSIKLKTGRIVHFKRGQSSFSNNNVDSTK